MSLLRSYSTRRAVANARQLRKDMPKAERIMWRLLRLLPDDMPFTFRRQHPVLNYIADFACIRLKLIVELDGESHLARQDYDRERDKKLIAAGYRILRFGNQDVYENSVAVMEAILVEMRQLGSAASPPPNPPP